MTAPSKTEAWLAVVQDTDGNEESELVTISYPDGLPVIELTDGSRITAVEPAVETARDAAA